MLQYDGTAGAPADDHDGQDGSREGCRPRPATTLLRGVWNALGHLVAPTCAAIWMEPHQAIPWASAWLAGSLTWAAALRRRSHLGRPSVVRYGGRVVAGAVAAVSSQSVFGFSISPAVWLAVGALQSGWLVIGFGRGWFGRRPVLVAVGGGRTVDLKKKLGEQVEWFKLGEVAPERVDAFVVDPHAMSQRALAEVDPSIWCHRIVDAGRTLEELQGRVALAAWSGDRVVELSRRRSYERSKRMIDLAIVVLSAPISIPLCALIALMIRLDSPGPILFVQQRTGRGGRPFRMLKFRSMTASEAESPSFTTSGDQRITRVGKLIRSNRLDELPQLLNVLGGSMSLVGPRPEQVPFVERLVQSLPAYDLRHAVKPGITGWAQLEQGYVDSLEATARKLEYDLFYITRRSLSLDVRILIKTVPAVLYGVEAERIDRQAPATRSG